MAQCKYFLSTFAAQRSVLFVYVDPDGKGLGMFRAYPKLYAPHPEPCSSDVSEGMEHREGPGCLPFLFP